MTGSHLFSLSKHLILICILSVATGCATTQTPDSTAGNSDDIESANRVFFNVNETLDKHLMKPIAETYVDMTPKVVRTSVTNFFDNLKYLNVIFNDFLQGKFTQGVNDSLRFLFNSTLGIGGIFDVASNDMNLAKNEEDFGQTLATWGFDEGSYLYIPLMGPNTVRDVTDQVPSTFLNPFFYVTSTVLFPISALDVINKRANLLEASNLRDEAAIDPYAFTREAFLQQRDYLIYDGNPPVAGYDDIFTEAEEESGGVLVIE
ncbi:MAG: VacJ family lipoprotein [Proteobacteria bacterium]|nr:VacJ family lipoprotein [Pseudomonadota bacterium]NOG61357.1 VacJ family lipoprotein [Pseudomonadota bacterium]